MLLFQSLVKQPSWWVDSRRSYRADQAMCLLCSYISYACHASRPSHPVILGSCSGLQRLHKTHNHRKRTSGVKMFAPLFQNPEDSDVTVVLKCRDPAKKRRTTSRGSIARSAAPFKELKQFPAHKVLLKTWSGKLKAQVSITAVLLPGLECCTIISSLWFLHAICSFSFPVMRTESALSLRTNRM